MTEVCLVGKSELDLREELLASETARDALSSYELDEPFANTVCLETISLGAAVSVLNDLRWYLRRYTTDAVVLEPSVSQSEWLSRDLATAIRNETVKPAETTEFLKIYGLENDDAGPPHLVEPLFVRRIENERPEYDLREVDDTVMIRVTADEFGK